MTLIQQSASTDSIKRGKANRRRGHDGERELAHILRDYLGDDVTRNLSQSRDGGADLIGTPFILEVKRATKLNIQAWWKQAVANAEICGGNPALAYRLDRQQWQFVIPLGVIHPGFDATSTGFTVTLGLKEFIAITLEEITSNEK